MDIRRITDAADVLAAGELFDDAPAPEWTQRFLDRAGHHLLLAYSDGIAVGMVTGIELLHPDKGVEMILYELGVLPDYRRRGIASALIDRLAALARTAGCYDMWVLIEKENDAARLTYLSAGGEYDGETLFVWDFGTATDAGATSD
ncbi:GNAT family N-acetyltransferase [Amycolatopsis antarctica]|uniref:GNAT family N-acetyltransferase n=1 Tax=Amycolatopsis antarctica TaxID=1854586 RepID=A0A263D0N8_9PSEU|nr:GNAT family N-acetyltransferase [Amycolatopsis antarctica]OZM70925.1 GNAT family N-acetyltransferase [Amycolatopsis antarctica]